MKLVLLIALGILGSATAAMASPFQNEFIREAKHLMQIDHSTAMESGSRECKERYDTLFKDGVLNISIAFGYGDNSPHYSVNTPGLVQAFKRMITMYNCPTTLNACGFKVDSKNPNVFWKKTTNLRGQSYPVRLHIIHGAMTDNNDINTGKQFPQQKQLCLQATRNYSQDISSGSEVVLYSGHSRNGGGPDFCPPRRYKNGHTNYPFYEKHEIGLNVLLASINLAHARGKNNSMLGLFGCYTEKHFLKEIQAASPETGFIVTRSEHSQSLLAVLMYNSLDSILAKRCQKGFEESLQYGGVGRLRGMFTPSK